MIRHLGYVGGSAYIVPQWAYDADHRAECCRSIVDKGDAWEKCENI